MNEVEVILWDFDGVLICSNDVRTQGFREVLGGYPKKEVEKLISFHEENGGLSRYVKFRYFFEEVRGESVSEIDIERLAATFSSLMLQKLTDKGLLIKSNIDFIRRSSQSFPMHIVSGSDHKELNFLCKELGINGFFKTIEGSPTPKNDLVANLLDKFKYNPDKCVLIGDSINDYEAARVNNVRFKAFGSPSISHLTNIDFSI